MPMHSDPLSAKLHSPELHRMAEQTSGSPTSVLIELDLPPRQIHIDRNPHRPGERGLRRFINETPEQQQAAEATVAAAAAFLEKTLGSSPHWLRAARAFVADVTPDQLRTLALSPLIKAIRPNRHLEAGL